jgi:hypothetical protein
MLIKRDSDMVVAKLPTRHYLLCRAKQLLEPFWVKLGDLEARLLQARLQQTPIDRPIYVTGLARSGTTITLTLLSQHRDVATHRYRDMILPDLPFTMNWLMNHLPLPSDKPKERIHKDGLFVTRESPEAVEEALWNRFFAALHEENSSAVLDATACNHAFEAYYKATIGKLLLAHQRSRYLSKANYNLTRLAYLIRLFPNARFIVMVRQPVAHFISWVKQHDLFLQTQAHDSHWFEAIRMVGHSEFGRDHRFVNAGDTALVGRIRADWDAGNRARAFGLYWASMYAHVLDLIARDPLVRDAVLVVHHEDLCSKPQETMDRMLAHVQLDAASFETVREQYAKVLAPPQYYRAQLDDEELHALLHATREVAGRLGYV